MDFYFGLNPIQSKTTINIVPKKGFILVQLPETVLKKVNLIKLSNWIREINGEIFDFDKIKIPSDSKVSYIYYSYYHLIE